MFVNFKFCPISFTLTRASIAVQGSLVVFYIGNNDGPLREALIPSETSKSQFVLDGACVFSV